MSDFLIGLCLFLFMGAIWVTPIVLGVRIARKKSRSPHWMWFGFHPIGGWITFLVLVALPPLKECPRCAEKCKSHAKVCPYCMTPFGAEAQAPIAPDSPLAAPVTAAVPSGDSLASSLRITLIIGRLSVSFICFFCVFAYALVFNSAVLHGELTRFTHGYARIPFREPALITLLIISGFTFLLVLLGQRWFFHRSKARPSSIPARNLIVTIIASALFETLAIYGLVMGFMFGPEVAPLTFVLMAITILGGILIFPTSGSWYRGTTMGV